MKQEAESFSARRQAPWAGWGELFERAPELANARSALDVGCGNGRFFDVLRSRAPSLEQYVGLDASARLLAEARARVGARGVVHRVDLVDPHWLHCVAGREFDLVVSWGLFHHLPSARLRASFVERLAQVTGSGGHLALTFWRFEDQARFKERFVPFSTVGIHADDVEAGDHLLRWQHDGVRYCHHTRATELEGIVARLEQCGCAVQLRFSADGASRALNEYLVLRKL